MKHKFQISESIRLGAILALSGGFMDAYSYMERGEVFANAQTGNMLLFGVHLSQGDFQNTMKYLFPVLAFALGIALAEVVRAKAGNLLHWRQISVLAEALILIAVSFFPTALNLPANALTSFACGIQVESFRKIHGKGIATTMCIGNLRSGMESLCAYGKTKDKKILRKSGNYFGIIFLFAVGAALGGHMIGYIGARTIWISCIILLISFLCMFIKEEKKEHPEIVQEEREIRENLQNIRKEAKDVEHILEDDIRSQIEK